MASLPNPAEELDLGMAEDVIDQQEELFSTPTPD
jgi:hypothetical protein